MLSSTTKAANMILLRTTQEPRSTLLQLKKSPTKARGKAATQTTEKPREVAEMKMHLRSSNVGESSDAFVLK